MNRNWPSYKELLQVKRRKKQHNDDTAFTSRLRFSLVLIGNGEVKHGVNGKREPAKTTSIPIFPPFLTLAVSSKREERRFTIMKNVNKKRIILCFCKTLAIVFEPWCKDSLLHLWGKTDVWFWLYLKVTGKNEITRALWASYSSLFLRCAVILSRSSYREKWKYSSAVSFVLFFVLKVCCNFKLQ